MEDSERMCSNFYTLILKYPLIICYTRSHNFEKYCYIVLFERFTQQFPKYILHLIKSKPQIAKKVP